MRRPPVEGGARYARLAGERLDVTRPAGRDLTNKEPVDSRADPPFGLVTLLCTESHVTPPFS